MEMGDLRPCILTPVRLLAFGLIIAVCSPSVLAAEDAEYLLNDAKIFEEELSRDAEREAWDKQDNADALSPNLFPVGSGALIERDNEGDDGAFVTVTVDDETVALTDVPKSAWFAPYVRAVAEEGIVSGYRDEAGNPLGLYGPADSVTMEQVAKIAVLAAGIDTASCAGPLKNAAAAGTWSAEFLQCAESEHWAVYSEGTVDPLRPATRSEVLVTILQAFSVELRFTDDSPFSDVDSSVEFLPAIVTAYEDHIVSGYTDEEGTPTGKFGPHDPVNRAELAKMVTLALEVYGD